MILSKLGAHKVAGLQNAIEAVGSKLLFLRCYCANLDQIKQVIVDPKHLLRTPVVRIAREL